MDPGWLSKAYLVFDEPGGTAVFVDSGAPLEPLLAAVDEHELTVTHVLTTHGHGDHIAGHDELVERFSCPVVTGAVETGGLKFDALPTPGHSDDGVAFVVNSEAVRINEFAATFARVANRPLRVWRMPAMAARVVGHPPMSGTGLSDAVFSNVRLRGTGFRFLYPTLEQGFQQIVGALDE